jgi:hypothetical protein
MLQDELGYTVRRPTTLGYDLFYVDLSSWKSDQPPPVIWVKAKDRIGDLSTDAEPGGRGLSGT